jgi:hypothetical protein
VGVARRLGFARFHPTIGGMPPELGWKMLRLFEGDVLPCLATP